VRACGGARHPALDGGGAARVPAALVGRLGPCAPGQARRIGVVRDEGRRGDVVGSATTRSAGTRSSRSRSRSRPASPTSMPTSIPRRTRPIASSRCPSSAAPLPPPLWGSLVGGRGVSANKCRWKGIARAWLPVGAGPGLPGSGAAQRCGPLWRRSSWRRGFSGYRYGARTPCVAFVDE